METFAEYILKEENLASKMEIVYYLSKKEKIFFDKSVIFKTELARLFIKYNKLEVDENLVLTACLLCNCKKVQNSKDLEEIRSYAKKGAEFLETLGFDKKFCKICEEVNRYSKSNPREKESDILELVEHFGGMLLDRPERIGFEPDEAIVLLLHRNLKSVYNRYLEKFIEFINFLERINLGEFIEVKALKRLTKMYNETDDLVDFIKKVVNNYEVEIDTEIKQQYKELEDKVFQQKLNNNRPLFTEATTKEIMENIEKRKQLNV